MAEPRSQTAFEALSVFVLAGEASVLPSTLRCGAAECPFGSALHQDGCDQRATDEENADNDERRDRHDSTLPSDLVTRSAVDKHSTRLSLCSGGARSDAELHELRLVRGHAGAALCAAGEQRHRRRRGRRRRHHRDHGGAAAGTSGTPGRRGRGAPYRQRGDRENHGSPDRSAGCSLPDPDLAFRRRGGPAGGGRPARRDRSHRRVRRRVRHRLRLSARLRVHVRGDEDGVRRAGTRGRGRCASWA